MRVEVSFEVPAELGERDARLAAQAALSQAALSPQVIRQGTLAVIFVSDQALAQLHGRFLDDDSLTDVLAFNLSDEDRAEFEVYVSVDRARAVALARGVSVDREQALYVVHGTLHLCGFDDHEPDDRTRMRVAEACVMRALGYADDDAPHEFVGE